MKAGVFGVRFHWMAMAFRHGWNRKYDSLAQRRSCSFVPERIRGFGPHCFGGVLPYRAARKLKAGLRVGGASNGAAYFFVAGCSNAVVAGTQSILDRCNWRLASTDDGVRYGPTFGQACARDRRLNGHWLLPRTRMR